MGLEISSVSVVLLAIISIYWVGLYFLFLFGLKTEVNMGKYFSAMFKGYRSSNLLVGWKALILAIEYVLGLFMLVIIKSAWYLSEYTKKAAKWIFIAREENEEK